MVAQASCAVGGVITVTFVFLVLDHILQVYALQETNKAVGYSVRAFTSLDFYFFTILGDDNTIPLDHVSFLLPLGNPGHIPVHTSATLCMSSANLSILIRISKFRFSIFFSD